MALLAISQGNTATREVHGQKEQTISFVGTNDTGSHAKFGIGIIFPQTQRAHFWGILGNTGYRHKLIASWRGWKILEQVKHIDLTTLCACLACGHHTIAPSDSGCVETLTLQFGEGFMELRDEILTSLPTFHEIVDMTDLLMRNGIPFSAREIVHEYARLGVRAPKHIRDMSHSEPPETMWEYCTHTIYRFFH